MKNILLPIALVVLQAFALTGQPFDPQTASMQETVEDSRRKQS